MKLYGVYDPKGKLVAVSFVEWWVKKNLKTPTDWKIVTGRFVPNKKKRSGS